MTDPYSSSLNISPDVWGPHFWRTMECIACTMNKGNKKNVQFFFDTLRGILPCEKCRNHYCRYMDKYPLQDYLYSPLTLLIWLYRLKKLIKTRQERDDAPLFTKWIDHMAEMYEIPELYYYMDKTEEIIRMLDTIGMKHELSPYYHKFRIKDYKEFVTNGTETSLMQSSSTA